eukprot:Hpha_TRINITY_DN15735_c5_g1::TRINITY_DN15735_c5_g1_i8::g.42012::m.42012/K10408/DNAH; dynein heavy chain, axonemal
MVEEGFKRGGMDRNAAEGLGHQNTLGAAVEAVRYLTKRDIEEFAGLRNPPLKVISVMDAVAAVLGGKVGWDAAKRLLNESLVDRILAVEPEILSDRVLGKLKGYVKDPDFFPDLVRSAAKACGPLCQWVRAVEAHATVMRETVAEREAVVRAEQGLSLADSELKEAMNAAAAAASALAHAQGEQVDTLKRTTEGKEQASELGARLEQVKAFVGDTLGLKEQWIKEKNEVTERQRNLFGDSLLGAACVAYSGPLRQPEREALLEEWKGILKQEGLPFAAEWSIIDALSPTTKRQFASLALPQDARSMWPAVVISRSLNFCMCLDPDGIAVRWIQGVHQQEDFNMVPAHSVELLKTLQTSVRSGCVCVVDGVHSERVEAPLRTLFAQPSRDSPNVRLGEADLSYSAMFRLFVLLPRWGAVGGELQSLSNCVDFSAVPEAVRQMILDGVAQARSPLISDNIAQSRVEVHVRMEELSLRETELVNIITEHEGEVIDDFECVERLRLTRLEAEDGREELEAAQAGIAEAVKSLAVLQPVADRIVILYEAAGASCGAEPRPSFDLLLNTYVRILCGTPPRRRSSARRSRTSVRSYTSVGSDKSGISDGGLCEFSDEDTIRATITTVKTIARGMAYAQRRHFRVLVSARLAMQLGELEEADWQMLIKGAREREVSFSGGAQRERRSMRFDVCPSWVPRSSWTQLQAIGRKLSVLQPVLKEIQAEAEDHRGLPAGTDPGRWEQWQIECSNGDRDLDPLAVTFPLGAADQLTSWHRCIVCKHLCIPAFPAMLDCAVEDVLGPEVTMSTGSIDVQGAVEFSDPVTPILITGCEGECVDSAIAAFRSMASQPGRRSKLCFLPENGAAMAIDAVRRAQREGVWLLLVAGEGDCSWMGSLEAVLIDMRRSDSSNFRLWIAVQSADQLPPQLLCRSLRIAIEPPGALAAQVCEFLGVAGMDADECGSDIGDEWRKFCSVLVSAHVALLCRKIVGPRGWPHPVLWQPAVLSGALLACKQLAASGGTPAGCSGGGDCGNSLETLAILHMAATTLPDTHEAGIVSHVTRDLFDPTKRQQESDDPFAAFGEEGGAWGGDVFAGGTALQDVLQANSDPLMLRLSHSLPATICAELHNIEGRLMVEAVERSALKDGKTPRSFQGREDSFAPPQPPAEQLDDMLAELPGLISSSTPDDETYAGLPQDGVASEHPFADLLRLELACHDRVTSRVRADVNALLSHFSGNLPMTEETRALAETLLERQSVPESWSRVGYPAEMPLAMWLRQHSRRVRWLDEWHRQGPPPCMWLPCFAFPRALLSAVLRVHCRTHPPVRLSDLRVGTQVTSIQDYDSVVTEPESGTFVYGLELQHAVWREGGLREQIQRSVLAADLPVLHLCPTRKVRDLEEDELDGVATRYDCPVFLTRSRAPLSTADSRDSSNQFLTIELPCKQEEISQWTLLGVAAFPVLPKL